MYRIESLKPRAFESPAFKLEARESCVGDTLEGIISFTDSSGIQQSIHIEPFEIKYVCNLLVPKQVSKGEFDKNTIIMDDQKLILDCDGSLEEVENSISTILQKNNFYMLQQDPASRGQDFIKLEGYAQGKYDQKDVGLSIIMQELEAHTQLIVKAMSDERAKLTDILRDISTQCDDIKSDTELIKEYTSQIDELFGKFENKLDDMEDFLIDKLGSNWNQVKDAWKDYKEGNINKKQLILRFIKQGGKKVLKKMVSTAI